VSCHDGQELHGDGSRPGHRLDTDNGPTCERCHGEEAESNVYHAAHWGDLSCQGCHSQDYKSCNSCHAGSGLASPSYMSFKIGRNPVPDERPYPYVTLRHAPVSPDTYREWGVEDLAAFGVEPTWRYAAPHNIRRWTARTQVGEGESCAKACHDAADGPDGVFLRQADLDAMSPVEAEANRNLIVPDGSPVNW